MALPSVISVGFFHGNFIKVFGTAPGAAAARTRAGACTAGNTGTRTRAAGMVGVIRTAAAPPGTTAAGLSAPGLEVCGWGNAMVAFWRGITGNMDMGVPVGIPVPVVGVILAKTTVPDPVCAGNGNRDQSNHDNDQKGHEEEN